MPFKSEAQRKYLWANEPGIARDWTDKHGSGAAQGGRIGFVEGGTDWGQVKANAPTENIVQDRDDGSSYEDRYNQMVRSHGGTPKKKDTWFQKNIYDRRPHDYTARIKHIQNLSKVDINKLIAAGVWQPGEEEDYFEGSWIGDSPITSAKSLKQLKDLTGYTGGYHDVNDPGHPNYDPSGGGEEGLYPQGGIASTPIKEEVASNDLGEGHFKLPEDLRAAQGGRIGLFEGGGMTNEDLAAIDAHAATVENITQDRGDGSSYEDRYNQMVRSHGGTPTNQGGGGGNNLRPTITYTEPPSWAMGNMGQIDKFGFSTNIKNLIASGRISVEDALAGNFRPDIDINYAGNNFNITGQKRGDVKTLQGNAFIGPVNLQGSYQDVDGNINKNIGATTNLKGVNLGVNYDFKGSPILGASYNTGNFSGGLTYDGKPEAMFSYSKKLEPEPKYIFGKAEGGLADILQVPRKGYAQAGSVGPKPFLLGPMPRIDPYDEFFLYQNKLMRKKKGLAKILEV